MLCSFFLSQLSSELKIIANTIFETLGTKFRKEILYTLELKPYVMRSKLQIIKFF